MIESVATIVINKPLTEVFQFVAQVANIPRWVQGAHVVNSSEGSVGNGTIIQQGQVVARVTHVRVNQGFETESTRIPFPTRLLVKHSQGMVQVEPAGQGTQLTLKEQLEPTPLLKPFEHLVAKKAHRDSQAALEQLKQLLEHQTGEASIK
ncbi:MAG TPA: SRPBCC family protein [Ktedonobacteraceae bacterium]|nr:SRPBCC family protein [Ktedonobacteraceae bacterium]